MMKQIAGTINLDRVKEASSFSSDIYSLWVWNSPQAAAPAQASSQVQVLRRLIGRYPGTSYYDRLGFILCCYIKFTVMMALYSKWRITALCYFPSDIQSSPGYYCTDPSVLSHFVIFQQNSKRIKNRILLFGHFSSGIYLFFSLGHIWNVSSHWSEITSAVWTWFEISSKNQDHEEESATCRAQGQDYIKDQIWGQMYKTLYIQV